jgi:hypothetical protein
MIRNSMKAAASTFAAALLFGMSVVSAKSTTMTGVVGDAMCGVKHMMADGEKCTHGCVKEGSDYALIVKDKAYKLKTSSDTAKEQLGKLAGKSARIVGDLDGDTITVTSVEAAK